MVGLGQLYMSAITLLLRLLIRTSQELEIQNQTKMLMAEIQSRLYADWARPKC